MGQVFSITDIISQIKHLLEDEFRMVAVEGEISNLSGSAAGHWYFTLSDDKSSLSCALFKMDAFRNPLIKNLKNGDKITVTGPISVYARRGSFQLLAKKLYPAGKGDLSVQLQILKDKLASEGLFDIEFKRPIPTFPSKIAVITALKGAALQDFLKIISRRSLWHHIVIVPAIVQGEASASSLISAIDKASQLSGVETIVITRGGGSLEDLWSFNDEKLARTIFECKIPVISAVGHEVDFSICDYVADLRLETPSAAAEYLSQPHMELFHKLEFLAHKLKNLLQQTHGNINQRLIRLQPTRMLATIQHRMVVLKNRLIRLNIRGRLHDLTGLYEFQQYLDELGSRMVTSIHAQLNDRKSRLNTSQQVMISLNPKRVLERGYSFIETSDKEVVTNLKKFHKIKEGEIINIHFSDGLGQAIKKDLKDVEHE